MMDSDPRGLSWPVVASVDHVHPNGGGAGREGALDLHSPPGREVADLAIARPARPRDRRPSQVVIWP
jgi:hypothetical protein